MFKTIYVQTSVLNHSNTKLLLSQYPDAEHKLVSSHWRIPELADVPDNAEIWNQIKRDVLIIGEKKELTCRPNGRSTDFIAPSHAQGCVGSCVYCYNARRKGYSNPVTVFVNIEQICKYIKEHVGGLPSKTPNQCDDKYWTYDIGENNDCSMDAKISNNVKTLVNLFKTIPGKACFATKFVNRDLLSYDPQQKTRIRFSLLPSGTSKLLDVKTSLVEDRVKAINDFVDAGYEVHINLSPVVIYEGWTKDYAELFQLIRDNISEKSLNQLKSEVIFLTHNEELHQINLKWHPRGEELIWTPKWQEPKISQTGGNNLRYKYPVKGQAIDRFKSVYQNYFDLNTIRYCF